MIPGDFIIIMQNLSIAFRYHIASREVLSDNITNFPGRGACWAAEKLLFLSPPSNHGRWSGLVVTSFTLQKYGIL